MDRPPQHSYQPPGYRAHGLHTALVLTGLVGRVSPLWLLPLWLALAALAGWPWPSSLQRGAALLTLGFIALDGVGLVLLPRRGRSYGAPTPPMLALALLRTVLALLLGWLWPAPAGLALVGVLNLAAAAIVLDSTWRAPFRLQVTRQTLCSTKLNGARPLRVLHVSDIHVERRTSREERMIGLVRELEVDLVVLTGDYLNLSYVRDARAQADARAVLAELCEAANAPVFAVTGSPPVDPPDIVPAIFDGLPITWLDERSVLWEGHGQTLRIAGMRCLRERALDVPRLRRLLADGPDGRFTLLLYHSPDLMPEAAEACVDLYLCGHTHGGQMRLPLFGALITSSAFWKRYEAGRYCQGETTLYVSRGIGMEGLGAPRARLLAPPELVLWELSGPAGGHEPGEGAASGDASKTRR